MLKWSRAGCEAQTEGFVFGNSNLEHLCWEHGNLHFIPQPEPHRAESVCSRASTSASASAPDGAKSSMQHGSRAESEPETECDPPPHLHDARVEDLLRGFAKDPKALAHTLRDFTVRTLLAMTDPEFQAMFAMFERHELSVADFFALKVGVREAKRLLLTIQF
ncbi:hypothetical protein M758_10G180300 [Ceratodon purpureus]|uniref:Uncharacterized protein n=1 Tax=Ceratodon purpureus TaxID=3225 RepID=A0A8T0GN99_CERPU|nr:hypothetical protein KC19_10G184700 [Ceratodon purpureus]KAG0604564.1 hypothetical protein M758_10G180300 [Ceratodon purpureus]